MQSVVPFWQPRVRLQAVQSQPEGIWTRRVAGDTGTANATAQTAQRATEKSDDDMPFTWTPAGQGGLVPRITAPPRLFAVNA